MGTARILSLGKDATLMHSRTMVLAAAGYDVSEAYSVDKAIALAQSDLIDVSVICHTVDRKER
jgi:DNA-binding response OmpR family regulator